jgi:hypothetical protein
MLPAEMLAAGDGNVLSTMREQKHFLHYRSHCRYRHRPQISRVVLDQGFSVRIAPGWKSLLGNEEMGCGKRAARCGAFARSRTVDDR